MIDAVAGCVSDDEFPAYLVSHELDYPERRTPRLGNSFGNKRDPETACNELQKCFKVIDLESGAALDAGLATGPVILKSSFSVTVFSGRAIDEETEQPVLQLNAAESSGQARIRSTTAFRSAETTLHAAYPRRQFR